MDRHEIIEAFAEAAHEAWLSEKLSRLAEISAPETWLSETGEEQLVPWAVLSEPVRDFDRIVVGAIYDVMVERGIVQP